MASGVARRTDMSSMSGHRAAAQDQQRRAIPAVSAAHGPASSSRLSTVGWVRSSTGLRIDPQPHQQHDHDQHGRHFAAPKSGTERSGSSGALEATLHHDQA